jgi:hypothetical protein
VASLRHFAWLLFDRGGVWSTPDAFNYGDLPLHWTYVSYLANGPRFWPENPIFSGARLRYPFGADLLTALFVRLGGDFGSVARPMGVLAAALLAVALHRWGRGFAVAAFLLSGGIGGADAAWKNLFLALFVPQRGFLFALPAGLLLLWSWRARLLRGARGLAPWVEGLLWGVMPLFHLHTFLFLSILFLVWTVAGGRMRAALPTFLWAVAPATWCTYQVTDAFRAASLVWWKPGWVMDPSSSAVAFLLANFTLFLPLFVWAALRATARRDREAASMLLPGLSIWAALFLVALAPWEWDNTKVMIWCYLLMLPSAERLCLRPLEGRVRSAVVAALLAPGALALLPTLNPSLAFDVVREDELASVCEGLSEIPPEDRVAAHPTFNHPVALCGHPVVAGYPGHLWSHGLPATAVQANLSSLMMGERGWLDLARTLEARWLFWGPLERRAYPGSTLAWERSRRLAWRSPWGSLYDLSSPSTIAEPAATTPRPVRMMIPPARVKAVSRSPNRR